MSITAQSSRIFFDGTNVATTGYVYDTTRSGAVDVGWYRSKADHIAVQIGCATLAATLTYRVEGKFDGIDRIASVYIGTIPEGENIDEVVTVTDKYSYIRLGIKFDSTASPNNVYAGLALAEIR